MDKLSVCKGPNYSILDVNSHTFDANETCSKDEVRVAVIGNNESIISNDSQNVMVVDSNFASSQCHTESTNQSQNCSVPISHEFKLVQIPCRQGNIKNYEDEAGYVYTRNSSNNSKNSYFRCKNSKIYQCKAKVTVKGGDLDKAVFTEKHCHLPETKINEKTKFDKKLDEVCKENPFASPRDMYLKTKVHMKNQVDSNNIPELRRYGTFIHRRKKDDIPLLPKTISEFENLINDSRYKQRYTFDERDFQFYRGVWTNGKSFNIVFISESVILMLDKMGTLILLMDGTFKILPYHLKFCQLYIISVVYKDRCYPLAFIFMEKRDYASYDLIFTNLKTMIPTLNVSNIMTDYELATRKALRLHFPDSRLRGCFFHYVKAINKAGRRCGLNKDDESKIALQKICALALLPNEFVSPGFELTVEQFKNSPQWDIFTKYWRRQWAQANISVYGLKDRSNNFAESLNKTLNLFLKSRHPNIWTLITHMKLIEMDKCDELKRNIAGDVIFTRRNKNMQRLDTKITNATKIFETDEDVEEFLKRIIFNDRLETFFKERIFIEGVDETDEDDDDGEDSEEVIPNSFDEDSNFKTRKTVPVTLWKTITTNNGEMAATSMRKASKRKATDDISEKKVTAAKRKMTAVSSRKTATKGRKTSDVAKKIVTATKRKMATVSARKTGTKLKSASNAPRKTITAVKQKTTTVSTRKTAIKRKEASDATQKMVTAAKRKMATVSARKTANNRKSASNAPQKTNTAAKLKTDVVSTRKTATTRKKASDALQNTITNVTATRSSDKKQKKIV